jgi:2-polyprenyl-3-methyl-5-hydroxy-6-metoxy-1,4-benzoquinol methylase
MQVTLADGSAADLSHFDIPTLGRMQFEQEQAFAQKIKSTPKGSIEREQSIAQGYDTVCSILAAMQPPGQSLVMGLDPRYEKLVLKMLQRRSFLRSGTPRLFEIGYGSGSLLGRMAAAGFYVAGIEVSPHVRDLALKQVPQGFHDQLHLGNFATHPLTGGLDQFDVIYWNDVFEHIPTDELPDFLTRIYKLLLPGGCLITITPNWHERPSDVTGDYCAPRTEARGLHLKEYTLRETTKLLRTAGFDRVETPLAITPWQMVLGLGGLAGVKRAFEPGLEFLPFRLAEKMCRVLGIACTMAYKY